MTGRSSGFSHVLPAGSAAQGQGATDVEQIAPGHHAQVAFGFDTCGAVAHLPLVLISRATAGLVSNDAALVEDVVPAWALRMLSMAGLYSNVQGLKSIHGGSLGSVRVRNYHRRPRAGFLF